jgi:hypothetical protein
LKYTTNLLKYTTNITKCIEKHSNTSQIHSYILHTLKHLPNTLQYLHYIPLVYFTIPLVYSNMLPYMLKLSWNLSNLHLFVLPLYCFSKLSWYLIILPKYCCTCHDVLAGIQKWSIFHEFHKSYWFVKYLNPKLISWDIINTCWTYICWSQKLLTT